MSRSDQGKNIVTYKDELIWFSNPILEQGWIEFPEATPEEGETWKVNACTAYTWNRGKSTYTEVGVRLDGIQSFRFDVNSPGQAYQRFLQDGPDNYKMLNANSYMIVYCNFWDMLSPFQQICELYMWINRIK